MLFLETIFSTVLCKLILIGYISIKRKNRNEKENKAKLLKMESKDYKSKIIDQISVIIVS